MFCVAVQAKMKNLMPCQESVVRTWVIRGTDVMIAFGNAVNTEAC